MSEKAQLLPSIESVMARVNAGFALTPKQAAVYLEEAPSTLAKKRLYGTGPRFYKGEGAAAAIHYDVPDLIAYKEARRRQSTSDPGPQIRPRQMRAPAVAARSAAPQRRKAANRPKRSTGVRRRS